MYYLFLLVSLLFCLTGGASSNAYHQWGQPSDNTLSPHAVQSSGTLPNEVGSSLFINRLLKRASQKPFTSTVTGNTGIKERSSSPFYLQGSTPFGGSLKRQGTRRPFAPGSSSYPSVSLSSTQSAVGQSATVQSSQKQFTSNYGTLSGSSTPGSTSSGGSLQPQGTTSQFAPASASYNCRCVSLSSPQDVASVSARVQSSQKQFTSSYGSRSGSSTRGSTTSGGSFQPQGITSQFAPASASYKCLCVPSSSPQDVARQSNQEFQSYFMSQSQKPQRWQPSGVIQTSSVSQVSSLSQSSPMQSKFSSLSSARGSSGDFGRFVSAQDGSRSYGGLSQSPSSKYVPGSHAYAKLGYPPLAVSSQSTSNQRSNGLYSSDSRRTQGLLGVVERTSRRSSDAPIREKVSERFVTLQHLTGSNRAPSLGSSSQTSSVGMFSGIPQTAQALRKSGSGVQLNKQPFFKPLLLRQAPRDSRKTVS